MLCAKQLQWAQHSEAINMYKIFKYLFLFAVCCTHNAAAKKKQSNNVITISEFKFPLADKSLFSKMDAHTVARNVVYVEFVLLKNITQFKLRFDFDMIKKDNRVVNLISHEFDGCVLMKMVNSGVKFVKLAKAELLRTSNIPTRCPLLAHTVYYAKNFTIHEEDYPNFIPSTRWAAKVDFFVSEKVQARMVIKGEVTKK